MKRFSDGNMGGPYKRSRMGPDDIEVRLLIPSKVAGSIIGKGGKNISRLRSDYKASVTVPDCPGPERILTVCSPEVETIIKVINEVVPNLEDTSGRSKTGDDVDIRMLVHQSQAGCIIGKGGLKVKELREKTGARIKIYTNCCPDSTDRVVQITGRGNTCTDCIQEMVELLKTVPVKGVDNQYDPINFDDLYAEEYGGYGQGSGGGGGGRGMMGGRDMGGPPIGSRDMGGRDMGGRDMGRGGRPAPFGGPNARGVGMGGPPPRGGGGFGSGGGGGGGGGFGGGAGRGYNRQGRGQNSENSFGVRRRYNN
uniref:K Homology domain-containing protein n=1 Tax=Cuerna arida TaxID=1464854 RepID=A0A1B6FYZ2_9HEMI